MNIGIHDENIDRLTILSEQANLIEYNVRFHIEDGKLLHQDIRMLKEDGNDVKLWVKDQCEPAVKEEWILV